MHGATQNVSLRERAKVVAKYVLAIALLSILAGFVLDEARLVLPSLFPSHSAGAFDGNSILNVALTALVGILVFRRMASRLTSTYWAIAVPVAALSGVINFLFAVMYPVSPASRYDAWLVLVCIAFELLLALLGFALRPRRSMGAESPNSPLERTRER